MFRSPQAGDWAADEEEDVGMPTVAPASDAPSKSAAPPPPPRSNDARRDDHYGRGGDHYGRNDDYRGRRDDNYGRRDSYGRGGDNYGRGGDSYGRRDDNYGRSDSYSDRHGGAAYSRSSSHTSEYSGGGRATGRWARDTTERNDRYERSTSGGYGGRRDEPPMVTDRGFVVAIKDNFGFTSCVDREGDLFFHITEAPIDLQVNDEVEFKVKFNNRSQKDIACQLVVLPKGTIVMEDVGDEVLAGVVTKGMPRHTGAYGDRGDRSRDDGHGLIMVQREEATDNADQDGDADTEQKKKREYVRFNNDSMTPTQEATEGDNAEESKPKGGRPRKPQPPQFGDEVRFRVATHRKTGNKRAVELVVTLSAKEKLQKEIEEKLKTMERECGIVERMKAGGGFIRCCDRPDDVFFPFHEVQASDDAENEKDAANTRRSSKSGGRQMNHECALREGDEVSFYVYEERDEESRSTRPRLTAMRVLKLPAGTVSFEETIRSDVQGTVQKAPKEPRNGPEVIGSIIPVEDEKTESDAQPPSSPRKKGGKGKKIAKGLPFRLSDTEDMSYSPLHGDEVIFDEVLDKRTKEHKAVNVRVLKLNPQNRESGVISALKEDFGFIQCADRAMDAYFRFSDVIKHTRDMRLGAEVAFDVHVDSKRPDTARATRVELLAPGTVQWETVVEEQVEGKVHSVPPRRANHHNNGGRGNMKNKAQVGRIRVTTTTHQIDYFPELKQDMDKIFLAAADEEITESAVKHTFPASLSKYERAAIHEYCNWLGAAHQSVGEGSERQLEVVAAAKVKRDALKNDETREIDVEFRPEDVSGVRYDPKVGDTVRFNLAVVRRYKQLVCKSVTCVKTAASETKAEELPHGEGYIVAVKSEGFGFIEQANGGDSLFFHIKEVLTGETQDELKVGMEVKFSIFVDEKKKKTRAVAVSILPKGTIKRPEYEPIKGIVTRPSLLNPKNARFKSGPQHKGPTSSLGRIRAEVEGEDASAHTEADKDVEDTEKTDAEGEGEEGTHTEEADTEEAGKPSEAHVYSYFLNDVTNHSVVLREGDEVQFTPIRTAKGMRAGKIQLLVSHARQGIVQAIREDLGGSILVDGEEGLVVSFQARQVLRQDVLQEGDRVEFALSKKTQAKDGLAGSATSVLRLSTGDDKERRSSRPVNSSLRKVMRDIGATAVALSRQAKGPDGTRGFVPGWRSSQPAAEGDDTTANPETTEQEE